MSQHEPRPVRVRAPGKVNLHLSVGPPRPDGYHAVVTVLQAVGLWDDVLATPGEGVVVVVRGEGEGSLSAGADNLAARAARLLARHAGVEPAVRLELVKSIPVAAGMAGGSADAAAALVACDALWGTGADRATLRGLAAELGSDVPFALAGGTALGRGRGEQLSPVLAQGTYHWVLAVAQGGLSTAAVYAEHDRDGVGHPPAAGGAPRPAARRGAGGAERVLTALRAGDAAALGAALSNGLQPAALRLRPGLAQVLDTGLALGALGALVSGSGPTCAFLAADAERAAALAVTLTAAGVARRVRQVDGPVPGARLVADEPAGPAGPVAGG